jgi:hypothetical protein
MIAIPAKCVMRRSLRSKVKGSGGSPAPSARPRSETQRIPAALSCCPRPIPNRESPGKYCSRRTRRGIRGPEPSVARAEAGDRAASRNSARALQVGYIRSSGARASTPKGSYSCSSLWVTTSEPSGKAWRKLYPTINNQRPLPLCTLSDIAGVMA